MPLEIKDNKVLRIHPFHDLDTVKIFDAIANHPTFLCQLNKYYQSSPKKTIVQNYLPSNYTIYSNNLFRKKIQLFHHENWSFLRYR